MEVDGLTPVEWINVVWLVSRVSRIIELAPDTVALLDNGSPFIVWGNSQRPPVLLEYDEGRIKLHFLDSVPEAKVMALIGACVIRDVEWVLNREDEYQA